MPNSESSDSAAPELKAGHPPAVKVGNMRVSQKVHHTHLSGSNASDKTGEEAGDHHKQESRDSAPPIVSFAPKTIIDTGLGGVPADTQVSCPEAVKQFHEKPVASHDFRTHGTKPHIIQQPRK